MGHGRHARAENDAIFDAMLPACLPTTVAMECCRLPRRQIFRQYQDMRVLFQNAITASEHAVEVESRTQEAKTACCVHEISIRRRFRDMS